MIIPSCPKMSSILSITFWMYLTSSSNQVLFIFNNNNVALSIYGGQTTLVIGGVNIFQKYTVPLNQWLHHALVLDGVSLATYYVNVGKYFVWLSSVTQPLANNGMLCSFGTWNTNIFHSQLFAQFDDVAFYSLSLTQEQLKTAMNTYA